ncbi:hypothetical protein HBI56_215020 [Parastagonospora nodorum]|uniref:Uncharacterized protein n=1 Tax=Phaeosphaeria nodorum (strain SN15 / ATCC MYA-4574 / FGSC 10173) TaxID=321614 RepID=A0A7U2I4D8_PHANO|nr:hypothetical protein HBH56_230980 [Parastagonospora nodorum]QRC99451.1 hypothetical protein JI435_413490 [Parastagonospora nodorum SN15]KAH3924538.1 hypothetical protein HBH54_194180 [Parastagonospora nodorum]KAH3940208.1 hypothetical protein HBH53_221750 [Parastagonospora nodorum]KAH3958345.1 hypothetical protein HBH51_210700 [Parastagonospora nodorum]
MPFLVAKVDEVSPFLWIFRPENIFTTVVSRAHRKVPGSPFRCIFCHERGYDNLGLKPEPEHIIRRKAMNCSMRALRRRRHALAKA